MCNAWQTTGGGVLVSETAARGRGNAKNCLDTFNPTVQGWRELTGVSGHRGEQHARRQIVAQGQLRDVVHVLLGGRHHGRHRAVSKGPTTFCDCHNDALKRLSDLTAAVG